MGVLEVKNLSLALNGKKILDDLSIDFWEGHVHALVGPNGAGKSTFAATIMGLTGYKNFSGDILFQNKSIKGLSVDERARKGITLAWQEPARFEGLKVKDFIGATVKNKEAEKIKDYLSKAGLDPDRSIARVVDRTLSGGERKKLELASMLAVKPKVALLDEPDSGIDVESLERIFDAVNVLKGNGTTVILITHSVTVLEQAEHAFLMCCGKLIEKGTAEKISRYFKGKCIPCDHKNEPEDVVSEAGE